MDRPRADRVRVVRRARDPRGRGRRRLARRRDRPALDPRLDEPGVEAGRLRHRRREGADDGADCRTTPTGRSGSRPTGSRDARADPALVLLAALHVGRARRLLAVQARARLREDARRARPRDARLVGEHDRRRGRVRAHGRRRDALAVLRAAARPQPAVRLRARARDQAQAADVLELGRASSSTYANIAGWEPTLADLETGPTGGAAARPLARRRGRTSSCTRRRRRTRRR